MRLFASLMLVPFLILALPVPGALAVKSKLETLTIMTTNGEKRFSVEVVSREQDRNRGLMYRRYLAPARGMLFDYDPPQVVGFWMKNTYIPLDIIFVDAKGKIIRIAENTVPLSLEHIPSGGVARGVLEINGGLSRKLGINAGDLVKHRFFQPPD